jgi:hypothetical protein
MKKERRWLKSVIAAAAELNSPMPWTRGSRRRPAAMRSIVMTKPRALAAR